MCMLFINICLLQIAIPLNSLANVKHFAFKKFGYEFLADKGKNCSFLPFFHSSIHKSEAILIKLCRNVCGHMILDDFDYGLDYGLDRNVITTVMGT